MVQGPRLSAVCVCAQASAWLCVAVLYIMTAIQKCASGAVPRAARRVTLGDDQPTTRPPARRGHELAGRGRPKVCLLLLSLLLACAARAASCSTALAAPCELDATELAWRAWRPSVHMPPVEQTIAQPPSVATPISGSSRLTPQESLQARLERAQRRLAEMAPVPSPLPPPMASVPGGLAL